MLACFCPNDIKFQLKKYRRLISHDTEEWCKVWRITDSWFQMHFDVLLLLKKYVWAKKLCVTTLKNDPNFEEKPTFWQKKWQKMTWGIWKILRRPVESLKICTLMDHFCRNYVMLELNKYRGVGSWRMTSGFKNDISNFGIWWISSWK